MNNIQVLIRILLLKFFLITLAWAQESAELGEEFTKTSPDLVGDLRTVTLKRVYHHGSSRFPKLLRRKDFTESSLHAQGLATGTSFTHTIRVINGTGVTPLSYTVEDFRQRSLNDQFSLIMDWKDTKRKLPNVKDIDTLINFGKITYNSYIELGSDDWYDLGGKYDVNSSFGWEDDGVRGYVFSDTRDEIMIVAIKGTSMGFGAGPTVPKDKLNDNRLFSCCCANVDRTWTPVCKCHMENYRCNINCLEGSVDVDDSYYNVARHLFEEISKDYPDSEIWLTGHSLGGALSSLIGITFGIPAVAIESPGERLPAKRLHLPGPPAIPYDKMNIWHIGHSADPIFMGVCNGVLSSCYVAGYALESKCHLGVSCLFDSVEKLKWRVDFRTHSIKEVIENVLGAWKWELPKCEPEYDCEDCGLWEYIDP